MSANPNGNRWAKSENFGKSMLKKSGWKEGSGLGKDASGVQEHIKVSRKADTMGIGYSAGVQDTWTTQSVGFADVLDRIKSKVVIDDSDNSDGEPSPVSSPTNTGAPAASRHYKMYAKRNALKTELLRTSSTDKSEEILGSASRKRRHGDDDAEHDDGKHKHGRKEAEGQSSLNSSVLSRIMVRCTKDEPKPNVDGDDTNHVQITKPNPRPAKCTATPFLAA